MPAKLTQSDGKRADVVEKLAAYVLTEGLADTGLRRLAKVAGTSDRMLLYYFQNKEEILSAVLTQIAIGLTDSLESILGPTPLPPARALQKIWNIIRHDDHADQLRLWLELSSHASRRDPFYLAIVADIRNRWIAWLSAMIEAPKKDKAALAILMMAAVDGQVVLFPEDLSKGNAAIRELVKMLEKRS